MKKTIMTVDDSTSVRKIVSSALREAGYNVLEAVDGLDALSKMDGRRIDLMFVDLVMPRMDGIDLIRAARSNPQYKYVPIIVLSDASKASGILGGTTFGATGWLGKPFKPSRILSVVKKLLG